MRKCWKCGKIRNNKKDCKSKNVDKPKEPNNAPSTKANTSLEEGGDVVVRESVPKARVRPPTY